MFITIDKNLHFQQNIKKNNLIIVVFQTRLNRIEYIRPLIPILLKKTSEMEFGEVYQIFENENEL